MSAELVAQSLCRRFATPALALAGVNVVAIFGCKVIGGMSRIGTKVAHAAGVFAVFGEDAKNLVMTPERRRSPERSLGAVA